MFKKVLKALLPVHVDYMIVKRKMKKKTNESK